MNKTSCECHFELFSFGYKYHKAHIADVIFDVRMLPNPYYVQAMKHKSGLDPDVYDYVIHSEEAKKLLPKLVDYIHYYATIRIKKHKTVRIGIGCTGGQHRSVAVVEYLKNVLEKECHIHVTHQDVMNQGGE